MKCLILAREFYKALGLTLKGHWQIKHLWGLNIEIYNSVILYVFPSHILKFLVWPIHQIQIAFHLLAFIQSRVGS